MVRIAIQTAFVATVIGLASAVAVERETPIIKGSLTKVNTVTNIKNLVDRDNARLNHYTKKSALSADSSTPVTNELYSYMATLVIGAQTFTEVIVDTGSSNTWVGAGTKFTAGSTGVSTGKSVSVSYGSGSFSGTEYTDTVSIGSNTVTKQSIGVAKTSSGFSGTDGILGLGPVDLTEDTVSGTTTVPTFTQNLKTQQGTPNIVGISFAPNSGSDSSDANGELDFGGVDTAKFSGTLTYTTAIAPYWGVTVSSFKYGSTSLGSGSASGIVDTGTTLVYIPTTDFNKFLSASGGKLDSTTGLAKFTTKPTQNFSFVVGGATYTMTPAQYLVPTAQYTNWGLSSGSYYAYINDGGSSSPNCILGMTFLENVYSVFDTDNNRVGLAPV